MSPSKASTDHRSITAHGVQRFVGHAEVDRSYRSQAVPLSSRRTLTVQPASTATGPSSACDEAVPRCRADTLDVHGRDRGGNPGETFDAWGDEHASPVGPDHLVEERKDDTLSSKFSTSDGAAIGSRLPGSTRPRAPRSESVGDATRTGSRGARGIGLGVVCCRACHSTDAAPRRAQLSVDKSYSLCPIRLTRPKCCEDIAARRITRKGPRASRNGYACANSVFADRRSLAPETAGALAGLGSKPLPRAAPRGGNFFGPEAFKATRCTAARS